jgi:galactokinase
VQTANAAEFAQNVGKAYQRETGIVPGIYTCLPAEGAGLVERAEQAG